MSKKLIALIAIVFVVSVSGVYVVMYLQARAKLEFAELKCDLGEMHKSLQMLAVLQVQSAKNRLPHITTAIIAHENMLQAVADHNHELALKSAEELLKLFPEHKDGIRTLRESGQIFYLLRKAINIVVGVLTADQSVDLDHEIKKYYEINTAHDLVLKAVNLDPHFEPAIKLSKDIERAHETIALLKSSIVIEGGQGMVEMAADFHYMIQSKLTDAAFSQYGSVNAEYSKIEPVLIKAKESYASMQKVIDDLMQIILTYEGNRSKEYFDSVKEFVHVVRTGSDALLFPTGSLMQYRQTGSDAIQDYKRALSRIKASLPNFVALEESVVSLEKLFNGYTVFKKPETESIIDAHLELYAI